MVDRSKLSLPIISQSEGQGPDRWYHPCDVPQNIGDEHVRLFGKTKVTVNKRGQFVPHEKPAKSYDKASLSINSKRMTVSKFIEGAKLGMYDLVVHMHQKGMDKNTTSIDGYSALMCAAENGYLDIVQYLLDHKCDLFARAMGQQDSALTLAAKNGHTEVIDALLNRGISVDHTLWCNQTSLYHAASNGKVEAVKRLLRAQAKRDSRDMFGRTPLTRACQGGYDEIIEELFISKTNYSPLPNPDNFDKEGWTPLLWATFSGNDEACRILLKYGADINLCSRDNDKKTALYIAIENKFSKSVHLLLQHGFNFRQRIFKHETYFLYACFIGNAKSVEGLINVGCNVNQTNGLRENGLVIAAKNRHFEVSRLLVKNNCHLNEIDGKEGWTALKWASYHGDESTIHILLKFNANFNHDDPSHSTPLMLASMNGHLDCVKILLKAEAKQDVNAVNEYEWSALMLAVNNNHVEVVRLLLNHNANPDLQNNDGSTALYIAARLNLWKMIEILLQYNANTRLKASDSGSVMIPASVNGNKKIVNFILHARNKAIHDRDINGWYPLHFAAKHGHAPLVEYLLKRKGIQVDCRTKFGQTPLHLACRFSGNKEVVRLLLDHDANIEALDNGVYGYQTPLLFACEGGHSVPVGILLRRGANYLHQNNIGETGAHIAKKYKHSTVAGVIKYYLKREEEKRYEAEMKRLEEERIAREKAEAERLEAERLAAEKEEQDRLERERIAARLFRKKRKKKKKGKGKKGKGKGKKGKGGGKKGNNTKKKLKKKVKGKLLPSLLLSGKKKKKSSNGSNSNKKKVKKK